MLCRHCNEPIRLMFANEDDYKKGNGCWYHVSSRLDPKTFLVKTDMHGKVIWWYCTQSGAEPKME